MQLMENEFLATKFTAVQSQFRQSVKNKFATMNNEMKRHEKMKQDTNKPFKVSQ